MSFGVARFADRYVYFRAGVTVKIVVFYFSCM